MKEIFDSGRIGLALVEKRIDHALQSDARLLTEVSRYLLKLGGKRIRPFFAILSGKLFGMDSPTPALIDVAAGIELIHMATLLHDDIIDNSPTRRHHTSAFVYYGLTPTLLAGDFLLVKAFGLCARLDAFVIQETEKACVELTEGEILEGKINPDAPCTLGNYLTIVGKKTASLFSLAAAVGSHLAGAPEGCVHCLQRFGHYAGIAFQMIDDILDIVASEDLLGKPVGTDLRQQTPSLVNVLWINSGDQKAVDFFRKTTVNKKESIEAAKFLKTSPIISECQALAKQYTAQAQAALEEVNDEDLVVQVRRQFLLLLNYTFQRCLV